MKNFHEIDFSKVGARIRNARRSIGLTQEQAASRAFISSQYWSLLESGRVRASVNSYLQVAAVVGLTLDDIFCDDATSMRIHKAFSSESMLDGCTVIEKAIIGEMTLALKNAFERNRM